MKRYPFGIPVKIAFGAVLCLSTPAFSQAPYYQGKTITIIQGREPGGAGDIRVRALIPFLRKYIPGQPAIVIQPLEGFPQPRPDAQT